MPDLTPPFPGEREWLRVRGNAKAALVTPCLSHLPFHPSCFLGYGHAVLARRYDVEVLDLNAELHFKNRETLQNLLDTMGRAQVVSDALHLYSFYDEVETRIDAYYEAIPWENYPLVYVTPPSWFPTVPTEAVLRLSHAVKKVSPETSIFFFGNSMGSWTSEIELQNNGVQPVHLNDLFSVDATSRPVKYDSLPTPVYDHRDKYLFDLLPFMLRHGCFWGACRFCSLSSGWNAGYAERSATAAFNELEAVIDAYDPAALVCRDNSLNGDNLLEFCSFLESIDKPWCGMSRANLSGKGIEALRKAGCRLIYFGLESASDRMLRAMNKGITAKQMSDFVKRLHANGIMPAPSLIIDVPGEEGTDFRKTMQFLEDHSRYLEMVNVYPFVATPASEFQQQPARSDPLKLFQFLQKCEDLGLKVCIGEQCAEYVLFQRMFEGNSPPHRGPGNSPIPRPRIDCKTSDGA